MRSDLVDRLAVFATGLLALMAAAAGHLGHGTGWLLVFWVPSVVLALCQLYRAHSRLLLPPLARGNDGRWRFIDESHEALRFPSVHGRRYVTSMMATARLDDGCRQHRLVATAATLDSEHFRRVRMALRHPNDRPCGGAAGRSLVGSG